MYTRLLFLLSVLSPVLSIAQPDAYHADILVEMTIQYGLPTPEFAIAETEAAIYQSLSHYGAQVSAVSAPDDLPFTRVRRANVPGGLNERWDAAIGTQNGRSLAIGDKCLYVVWLRRTDGPEGEIWAIAERNGGDYAKDLDISLTVTDEWQRFLLPFEINIANFPAGGMTFSLHLGQQDQTVEIGGLTVLNFGTDLELSDLPSRSSIIPYGGFEADAAWRAPAARRIDSLRRADWALTVTSGGTPLANAPVTVAQQRHAFNFGTAIKACRWPGGRCANPTYVERLGDLDGEGHGFNTVVFENDTKWRAWEEEWFATNEHTLSVIDQLHEEGYLIRGHNLIWPGWGTLPRDLQPRAADTSYLRRRIDDHLVDFLQTMDLDAKITEWDVINETVTNTDLADIFGREIYADIFRRTRELAPDAVLYLNDFSTLTLGNEPGDRAYDELLLHLGEIVAAVPDAIDGIGFQAHIGGNPNGIEDVLATFDDFYDRFGLRAQVTEFDLPASVNEDLAADYLADFLTATYSHPSMDGFLFWNFWDVDTWRNPGANLYREDWSTTPAHDTFVQLLFEEWWTEEDLQTATDGTAAVRAYRGTYTVTVGCPDGNGASVPVTTTVELAEDTEMILDCDALVSTRPTDFPTGSIGVAPNPAGVAWTVTNREGLPLRAELRDLSGRLVWSGTLTPGNYRLPVPAVSGPYVLYFTDGRREGHRKLLSR